MRYRLFGVLFSVCLLAGVLWADENGPSSPDSSVQDQTAQEEKPSAPSDSSRASKKLQEFTPSEEISADKPVAFPVDI